MSSKLSDELLTAVGYEPLTHCVDVESSKLLLQAVVLMVLAPEVKDVGKQELIALTATISLFPKHTVPLATEEGTPSSP